MAGEPLWTSVVPHPPVYQSTVWPVPTDAEMVVLPPVQMVRGGPGDGAGGTNDHLAESTFMFNPAALPLLVFSSIVPVFVPALNVNLPSDFQRFVLAGSSKLVVVLPDAWETIVWTLLFRLVWFPLVTNTSYWPVVGTSYLNNARRPVKAVLE